MRMGLAVRLADAADGRLSDPQARSRDLSDEASCERWIENPCCEAFFQHQLPLDRSLSWRQRMGDERLKAMLQDSLTRTQAMQPKDLARLLRNWLKRRKIKAVIPSTATRRTPDPLDQKIYRRRNVMNACSAN